MLAFGAIVAAGILAGSSQARGFTPERAKPGYSHDGPCQPHADRLGYQRRVTFAYRIQQPWDIELMAKMRAHRRRSLPVRDNDIFMVRARGPDANRAWGMTKRLRNQAILSGQLFHCSRIIALTGVRTDNARPNEAIYPHTGNSRIWGVFPDWERRFWRAAYPNGPRWSNRFSVNVRRIRNRSSGIRGRGKYAGVVITGWRNRGPNAWNYGRLIKRSYLDGQIVQTQEECQRSVASFRNRARHLRAQYRNAGVGRAKLAMQVSFADNPGRTNLPHDVTPRRAAACTQAAYAAGVRTFLLWAYPAYLDTYFRALPNHIRR